MVQQRRPSGRRPSGLRQRLWPVWHRLHQTTGWARVLPDFLIIGGQRCGTSSLYQYLVTHPDIAPAFIKEVHFFDLNFDKGLGWYRSYFPSRWSGFIHRRRLGRPLLSGEASPYYLFHPLARERLKQTLPQARLIAILRDPVDRAYSHYHHAVRLGFEPLPFEEALAQEEGRLQASQAQLQAGAGRSLAHQEQSYLARGLYLEQLQAWHRLFPREQLLILQSEPFYRDPAQAVAAVFAFLGLEPARVPAFPPFNAATYPPMPEAMRRRLAAFYAPHNARLFRYLGRQFDWQSA